MTQKNNFKPGDWVVFEVNRCTGDLKHCKTDFWDRNMVLQIHSISDKNLTFKSDLIMQKYDHFYLSFDTCSNNYELFRKANPEEIPFPEKWCIKGCKELQQWSIDFLDDRQNVALGAKSDYFYNPSQDFLNWKWKTSSLPEGFTEITFEQFKTHVLKQTMEPKKEDLTGRYLKVINNKSIDHYPCRVGDYLKFVGIKEGMEFWGAYTSDFQNDGTANSRYFGINVHTNKQFELMPEGFDPLTFEVGKWYKNLGRFSDHIGKLCGEVNKDRFPCKEYISDEVYTDNGNFFGHFKNAVLLTDLSEIQEYLPDGHVDKVQAIPEYVKCTVTWMSNHTLGTIYKVYKDGCVENDNKEKSNKTWNGGGFEKSTKEAYDAQKDPNVFKAGTYIVLLASCDGKNFWKSSMPINHCYILKRDSHSLDIHIELDAQGSTNNGWSCGSYYDSKMKIRAATPEEIAEYDRLGKPYDVTTLGKVKGEVDMKDIQRQCKEKYPIGSVVEDADYSIEHCLEDDGCIYSIHGNQIYSIYGKGLLYDNGKWAKLISLPDSKPEKWVPEVGDWVVSTKNVPGKRKQGQVFRVLKLSRDKSCIYYEESANGDTCSFRPAEPHEIPKLIPKTDYLKNSCAEIFLTVPQVSLWGEPAPSTPNYLDPASLLPKIKLPI